MPLPFILLGAAAVAGGTGLVSGGMGAKKVHDAKKIISSAQYDYDKKKSELDETEKKTTTCLDELGEQKLEIWKSFKRFSDAFEKIKNKPQFTANNEDKLSFTKHELDEIQNISITAIDILGSSMLSAGAGALAGFAAYSGTMAIGVASTGTAISALSGAAATNATLAALGGGAIGSSATAGGMALGTTVLGAAVAGPVVAVGGLLLNAKGNSSLLKAEEVRSEVAKAIRLMNESINYLNKLRGVSINLNSELKQLFSVYEKQVSILEYLVSREIDYDIYSSDDKKIVENNIMLVKLLKQITQVDLIKEFNGKDVVQEHTIKNEIINSKLVRNTLAA
ncbi:hypothetical protein [Clostridium sulfidigenes]|uniref:hypothetical protein n=1 Tax=Clostridium sulfidigenes TaxID=318464 RepID=UPI003F899F7A